MKSLLICFGVVLLIICLPSLFVALSDSQSEAYSQTVAGISTAAGIYGANVTLGQDIYNSSAGSIRGISSNQSTDAPSAYSYNSVSHTVWVAGLDAGLTRTLSFDLRVDSSTLPDGAGLFLTLMRWFLMFILIGMSAGSIYNFFAT